MKDLFIYGHMLATITGNVWNMIYIFNSVTHTETKTCVPMSSLKLKNCISGITRNAWVSFRLNPDTPAKLHFKRDHLTGKLNQPFSPWQSA